MIAVSQGRFSERDSSNAVNSGLISWEQATSWFCSFFSGSVRHSLLFAYLGHAKLCSNIWFQFSPRHTIPLRPFHLVVRS